VDFSLTAEDLAFKQRLQVWLRENLPVDWRARCPDEKSWVAFQKDWDHRLAIAGWTGIWWPREFGGSEATPTQRVIYEELMAEVDAPEGLGKAGRRLLAPAIMRYGTETQKRDLLSRMLSGEDNWCQGFSEPDAGSDLASLQTRAVRNGEDYLVNGSKIWTSYAQYCNKCFLLARTDPNAEKHAGLTLLLLDMNQPGVDVRPIQQITGSTGFCQVFFTDATVPFSATLGGEGCGWEVSSYLLTHERGAAQVFARLIRVEQHLRAYAARALEAEGEEVGVARLSTEIAAARLLAYRILNTQIAGGEPGPLGSIAKLYWSEAWQRLALQGLLVAGEQGLTEVSEANDPATLADLFLYSRWATVSSGTSEVQRNIVAKRVLKLPQSG
jgi:alkylation response protein AidB-like acyl-CoA dehydrogenase